ncbi:telomere-associated protein RIF1 isoform X2 [Ornithorhynchus anatinus]|uniref:Replication timing regulatory factor 1 n=1 Tax=Ornithorhynchus anatinus TaxID=9258 RepID=A0A6I8P096_ORNAN|nr:telomere-associated protein RIF1 isoform X2 [Ornithorhynchus anatinus]
MAAPAGGPLAPLLDTLEDPDASPGEHTDAYLTLGSRLTGEEGKEFVLEIGKQLSRLSKVFQVHISHQNSELNCAALQALGFCLHNSKISSGLSESEMERLLSEVNSIAEKTSDKNTRTRALWVLSKQTFPAEIVGKVVPSIIATLERVFNKEDVHSMVVDYEALNVIIRLLEQAPVQMGEEAVRWAKLVIPLVVHSAPKVHLRGAAALELGMPLLLLKQQEVAAITEQLMTTKLISELQKLFMTKNETYVLKLWPLFVKLLGKSLHRSGSFINSLLQLEELGFRSGAPVIKKIAFIAWKSLIDNFALNPEILCSAKRLKLLMQPLSSIHVRTEALALTKLEVWWYLLMRLGSHLPANFEQVCVPLIQNTLSIDSNAPSQGTPSRGAANQSLNSVTSGQKAGTFPFGSSVTPRMNLSTSVGGMAAIPSIQLLGIEMLLHFLLGPEVLEFAKQNKLVLSLEPLQHPLISSPSFFCKHANTLIAAVQDGFIAVGKDASDAMINAIWMDLIGFVKSVIESGNKRERQGSEVLTLLLQALKNIVTSNALPVSKTLVLIEATIKNLPQKVLGSPAYQIANMDLLNGTPALFLIQLIFHNNLLENGATDERFFLNLETLVGYVLSGPTSPLAFSESVLGVINQNAKHLKNREHLWRMWSIIVNPLTELINRTNEVNQGDALEHNFSAVYSALILPINHIFPAEDFPPPSMKSLLRTWSELYRAFARCAALVATAEENLCCEELCAKIMLGMDDEALANLPLLDGIVHIITVMVDCIDFSPYSTKYQPIIKSPQTPTDWSKKKKEPLGKLASLFKFIVRAINSFHRLSSKERPEALLPIGSSIVSIISSVLGHISLPSVIRTIFATLARPLALFYENSKCDDRPKIYSSLSNKLEKLLGEIFLCLQSRYTGNYDNELLEQLSPFLGSIILHKNKQIRNQSAQFWNATFAKATMLMYPEELKPILNQAKHKTLLLLPGFESVDVVEESSGPYSEPTENTQLEAKISGVKVKSSGKRNSLLSQAKDLKEKNPKPPAKLKLEFSSPKVKNEILLEEEKSADFVFIPPEGKETKARTLTEHQKEKLRTKRVDIPVMYNNLDVSQDTALFSQYSQEESMEKGTLIEEPKDNPSEFQEEAMNSEFGNTNKHLDKASTRSNEGVPPKRNLELLSSKNDIEKNTRRISKSPSPEHSLLSVCSSSSGIVTPPQPTSRRQSFITLEKFDSSENRPFSPSALTTASGASSVDSVPEGQGATSTLAKVKAQAGKSSRPDSEKVVVGVKRASRRQNKAEQSGGKRAKFLTRPEQEKNNPESPSVESKQICPHGQITEKAGRLDPQSNVPGSASLEDETTDRDLKEENVASGEKAMEGECEVGPNLESKENTPPEEIQTDPMSNEDSQGPQIASNQKPLRRSSRRRSENAECATGSQDKENSHQKKERRKEEEKCPQKRISQLKDDFSPKQKQASAKVRDEQDDTCRKESNLPEKTTEETTSETEINKSIKKEVENLKSDGDSQDSGSDKAGEKPARGRTRYQTRRASQGLLSSIENSESDSSETKEDGSKKKRPGKWKNKTRDPLEDKEREEKIGSQEYVASETVSEARSLDVQNKSEMSPEEDPKISLISQTCEAKDGGNSSTINQCADVSEVGEQNRNGKLKTDTAKEDSRVSPCVSEPVLRTRHAAKSLNMEDSTVHSDRDFSVISSPSEKPLPTPECHHKRSRRVRKSKSCDCCGEKSQSQEKSFTELKSPDDRQHLNPSEHKKTGAQTTVTAAENFQLSPLSEKKPLKETWALKDSLIDSVLESEKKERSAGLFQEPLPVERVGFENKTSFSDGILEKQGPTEVDGQADKPRLLNDDDSLDPLERDPVVEMQTEVPVTSLEEEMNKNGKPEKVASPGDELKAPTDKDESEDMDTHCAEPEETEGKETDTQCAKCEEADGGGMDTHDSKPKQDEEEMMDAQDAEPKEIKAEEMGNPGAESQRAEVEDGDVRGTEAKRKEEEDVNAQPVKPEKVEAGEMGAQSDESDVNTAFKPEENAESLKFEVSTEADKCEQAKAEDKNGEVVQPGEPVAEEGTVEVDKPAESIRDVEKLEETPVDHDLDQTGPEKVSDGIFEEIQSAPVEVEKTSVSTNAVSEQILEESNVSSPQKLRGLDATVNESPSGVQTRCVWSPSASPSTSILKRGIKRPQEDETPSPVTKIRRVSFADPIYQAGLADDIDRRSPVVRSHSSNSSPTARSLKIPSNSQSKMTEMTKESMLSPNESVYPALMSCGAPIDIILPQITSNMWARGLGQLIRAKNIKTIGDLSTLTAAEIKSLPIRSPKVSNVKKALRVYHEQQMKSRGFEEITALDASDKLVNGVDNKPTSPDEERLATDLVEPASSVTEPQEPKDLLLQINSLALQLTSEALHQYSGSQLFEMQEKLGSMTNCIMRNLQSRWKSPPHESCS